MDEIVLRGMARWPNVPAVFGWLSLDRRGRWLLKGDRVTNPGITAFFGRNYSHDEQGRWFFQNGPQRVYVALDYTPHVYRVVSAPGTALKFESHCGTEVETVQRAYIDEQGMLLLDTSLGIGLLHDADLETMVPRFVSNDDRTRGDAALAIALEPLQAGKSAELSLQLDTRQVLVRPVRSAEVPKRFGFVARPVEPAGQKECY